MISTASDFLKLAHECKLVRRSQLTDLVAQCNPTDSPKLIAKLMIQAKLITRWHAEQLIAGRRDYHVGAYRLLEPLGTGSKGVVFKVFHEEEKIECVIKILAKNVMGKPGALERWEQEVSVITSLNHPNIIRAFRSDEINDLHLLVMEFVDGKDLSWWLDEYGRLPIDWSCELIRQASLGLQHALEKGVIHRDIKPGNILVQGDSADEFPQVKILDLGYARMIAEDKSKGNLRLTQANEVFGTPKYMAPEQAKRSRDADIRSDIYSLGCTLYKALVGDTPFEVTSGINIVGPDRTKPRKPSILRTDVPAGLDEVLLKAIAFNPEERYQTPRELVDALTPFSMRS